MCSDPRFLDVQFIPFLTSILPGCTEILLLARQIHGVSPKVLELMELSSHHNVKRNGLHLLFDDELSPFAWVIP
jgi:hypothetical protein